jgi:hypothetical protein
MGYRDDFYVRGNIVGHTGSVNDNPTVYFQSDSECGRITQHHDKKDNIGRSAVRSSTGYSLANEKDINGEMVAVERQNGERVHTSRNKFVPIQETSDNDLALLLQSLWKFPELKSKYSG